MWKKIAFASIVGIGVAAALVVNHLKPYTVERHNHIAAPPALVLAEFANLQSWMQWSPRERLDPNVQRRMGKMSGPGATYYWSGNFQAGEGRLTILSISPESVSLELEFKRPLQTLTDYDLTAVPDGAGSQVSWTASGDDDDDFMDKALGMLKSRDKKVGTEVEGNLAGLKKFSEAAAKIEHYRLERSTTMAAPPIAVLAEILDLHAWSHWSSREHLDPDLNKNYGGADAGMGASVYWWGNAEVGLGRLTVLSATADKVALEVEVEKPEDSVGDMEFSVAPDAEGTRVTWVIKGEKDKAGKAYSFLACPLDKLGSEMEKGLARMKAVVEGTAPLAAPKAPAIEVAQAKAAHSASKSAEIDAPIVKTAANAKNTEAEAPATAQANVAHPARRFEIGPLVLKRIAIGPLVIKRIAHAKTPPAIAEANAEQPAR